VRSSVIKSRAPKSEKRSIPIPRALLVEEGRQLVVLVAELWASARVGTQVLPGLSVVGEQRLSRSIGDRLSTLLDRMELEDRVAEDASRERNTDLRKRGLEVHESLATLSRQLLCRHVDPCLARRVVSLGDTYRRLNTEDRLAEALASYLDLLRPFALVLADYPPIREAPIAEAEALVAELRQRRDEDRARKVREVVAQRPKTAREVHDISCTIRQVARELYKSHSELYRRFTSDYVRTQRRRQREVARASSRPAPLDAQGCEPPPRAPVKPAPTSRRKQKNRTPGGGAKRR
jgi:hypothetical protein